MLGAKRVDEPEQWSLEQIEEMRKIFKINDYRDKPFTKVERIYAYKNTIEVRGRMEKFTVLCSNLIFNTPIGAEYRDSVEYYGDEPFTLKDAPDTSVTFSVQGTDGKWHDVYDNNDNLRK